jgi:CHAT domain-containing protein
LENDRLTRSAIEVGLAKGGELHFPRLVFTRQEANFIFNQAPAGQAMEALDFRASREAATGAEFAQYRIVHFLKLGARLVVLSACETALGKEVKGEGLEGLTRGFMYAGARQVVASLWQVDDVATAELMQSFYEGMLKHGLKPAAALRQAQIAMWKQTRHAAPYFWAGFVMQGDWN